jgi:protein-tyrosine-phosphatase
MNESLTLNRPLAFLKLLAHDIRWQILQALAHGDCRVQELVDSVGQPQSLVSYHLRRLREGHLVTERRSSDDARDIYYSLDLDLVREHYLASGSLLHPALCAQESPARRPPASPADHPTRVLFLCTHNSARSQMAEGILRHLGGASVEVFSAGSEPGKVHPNAIRAMADMDIDISQYTSKSMAGFVSEHFDYVITVCDRVREVCPLFPDDPEPIHWSIPDPVAAAGPAKVQYQAFEQVAHELHTRISYLLLMVER